MIQSLYFCTESFVNAWIRSQAEFSFKIQSLYFCIESFVNAWIRSRAESGFKIQSFTFALTALLTHGQDVRRSLVLRSSPLLLH